jgi:hypothetical protein
VCPSNTATKQNLSWPVLPYAGQAAKCFWIWRGDPRGHPHCSEDIEASWYLTFRLGSNRNKSLANCGLLWLNYWPQVTIAAISETIIGRKSHHWNSPMIAKLNIFKAANVIFNHIIRQYTVSLCILNLCSLDHFLLHYMVSFFLPGSPISFVAGQVIFASICMTRYSLKIFLF